MSTDKRNTLLAAALAVVVLVAGGLAYRILADRLGRVGDHVALPPGTLAHLPLSLGEWTGREVPLDAAIIKATATDDHVNRVYARSPTGQAVGLYVAYGVRARDLMPHRPEVCYPGGGWTLDNSEPLELPLASGAKLPCRIYRFSRGTLNHEAITVLNYYLVDGQYAPDVSLLRSKAWQGSGSLQYMVQVQVTCSGQSPLDPDAPANAVRRFAALSAMPIRALLPDSPATETRRHDDPSKTAEPTIATERAE
jgi:EpsI family protein